MILIVLPTLDGSPGAVQDRLEAWLSAPRRRQQAEDTNRVGTLGDRRDRLDLLGVA